ncbi:dihydroceramide fatty acyl 2-hydroxylase FAH1-like [Actinidia eriantha]|uniref:dihydroceramide fatty acyl 2-hydroxylase FAH1-like n=1 Tax=Actinidia eriantha TaxID=165200 RepID=UPI00258E1A59|nr:dihydroceramide fatty acyl 2-hydroxylase FAH1-like [Actinidia eriantha]
MGFHFGIFIWTLMEYTLHRLLFHIKTKSYWGNTLHYLLHGCHHKHPMDGLRLVFPPAATAVLCVPLCNLFKLLSTPSVTPALFGGVLLGYVMYDVTHYYLHHGQATSGIPRNLKVRLVSVSTLVDDIKYSNASLVSFCFTR